jgi:hypothetical protein
VDGMTSIDIYADEAEASERRAMRIGMTPPSAWADCRVEGTTAVGMRTSASAILAEAEDHRADVIVLGARSMGTVLNDGWSAASQGRCCTLPQASVLIVRTAIASSIEQEAEWAVARLTSTETPRTAGASRIRPRSCG